MLLEKLGKIDFVKALLRSSPSLPSYPSNKRQSFAAAAVVSLKSFPIAECILVAKASF